MLPHFKKNGLTTNVGHFVFDKQIGEGGNAKVFSFTKGEMSFAIKFIAHGRSGPLARFRDEFFSAAQIDTHPNIARAYHFDTTIIAENPYSLIVMKLYGRSLHSAGPITSATDETKARLGWALFRALKNGARHLHKNGIVHRDVKPQNIFYDIDADHYVIGDLGIAHFKDDLFPREAKTRKTDRMANFGFSAPEQINSECPPSPSMDVFAIGQVLNWYLRGSILRGGGRIPYSGTDSELRILDKLIDICVQNDPDRRFQSIDDMDRIEHQLRHPQRDIFTRLHDLDDAFRASIPRIQGLYDTIDRTTIDRFLTNFSEQCQLDEFWYIRSDGGDSPLEALSKLENGRWLFANHYEIFAERIFCYRHPSHWQSFFVVVALPDEPFHIIDGDGKPVERPNIGERSDDYAVWYQDRYIDGADADTGYFLQDNKMVRIDSNLSHERGRCLKRDAFLIVPEGTGLQRMMDRSIAEEFLQNIVKEEKVDDKTVSALLKKSRSSTTWEITSRL